MQPINYGGLLGQSLASGVQTGLGLGEAAQRSRLLKEEQEALQLARNQQAANTAKMVELYKGGSPEQMAEFSLVHPESGKVLMDAVSKRTGINQDEIVKVSEGILTNPKGTEQILSERIQLIQGRGGDPSDTVKMLKEYRENPQQFMKQNEMFYAMNNPEKYKQYRTATGGDVKPMTAYESAQIDIKKEEQRLKRLEILHRNAKTEAEKKKALLEIEKQQKKINDEKVIEERNVSDKLYSIDNQIKSVNDLVNNADYMESISGLSGRVLSATSTGVEAESYLDNIKNSLTIENLGVMTGPLTDSDIKIISSAASRLRAGMSEEALRKELNLIKEKLSRVKENYKKDANERGIVIDDELTSPDGSGESSITDGNYSSLWGD